MTLTDIFQNVRNHNSKAINNEYVRIRRAYEDEAIGVQMLQNDLQCNLKLWDALEDAVVQLFECMGHSTALKNEIIERLKLTESVFEMPAPSSYQGIHSAKELLTTQVFSFYLRAYSSVAVGDTEGFRSQALEYRLTSGLRSTELNALLQWIREFCCLVQMDEVNVMHLWKIYQQDHPEDIRELLYKALKNYVVVNGTARVEDYFRCVSEIDHKLKEVV